MKPPSARRTVGCLAVAMALSDTGCRRAETVTPEPATTADPSQAPLAEADLRLVAEVESAVAAERLRRDEARREIGRALAEGRPFLATQPLRSEDEIAKELGHDPERYRRAQLKLREAAIELQIREEREEVQRFRAVELDLLRAHLAAASDPAEVQVLTAVIAEIEAALARDAEPPSPERAGELALVAARRDRVETPAAAPPDPAP